MSVRDAMLKAVADGIINDSQALAALLECSKTAWIRSA